MVNSNAKSSSITSTSSLGSKPKAMAKTEVKNMPVVQK